MPYEAPTKESWLDYVKIHKDVLENFLANYHPVYRGVKSKPTDRITAPNAERACEVVRADIRRTTEGDPVKDFRDALTNNNVNVIAKLLNQAWFGVPESRDCWSIQGFKEAVHLVEDVPTDDVIDPRD